MDDELESRPANQGDLELYLQWANDEDVRRNSYTKGRISRDAHIAWFHRQLEDTNVGMYVFCAKTSKEPVGQVRLTLKSGYALIGISLDRAARGRGFAPAMIKCAIASFREAHGRLLPIHAYIIAHNVASVRAFTRAGFLLVEECEIDGQRSIIMINNVSQ